MIDIVIASKEFRLIFEQYGLNISDLRFLLYPPLNPEQPPIMYVLILEYNWIYRRSSQKLTKHSSHVIWVYLLVSILLNLEKPY